MKKILGIVVIVAATCTIFFSSAKTNDFSNLKLADIVSAKYAFADATCECTSNQAMCQSDNGNQCVCCEPGDACKATQRRAKCD